MIADQLPDNNDHETHQEASSSVSSPSPSTPPACDSSDSITTAPSQPLSSSSSSRQTPSYSSTDRPQPSSSEPNMRPTNPSNRSAPPSTLRLKIAGGIFGTLIVGLGIAAATGRLSTQTFVSLAEYFEHMGPSAIYYYAILYFCLELVAVPALPLTLGSGYLFGVTKGTIAVSISSSLAAATAFLIARYALRDAVMSLAARYPKFRAMDRAISREGFKFVFLLRLSPLLPFSISNYLYGLTSVPFLPFAIASWAGMLPGTIAYVSTGAAVNALQDIGSGDTTKVNPVLLGIGLVATVLAITFGGRAASRAIAEVEQEGSGDNGSADKLHP